MTDKPKSLNVTMLRADLANIAAYSLPRPFTFRWYHRGDEETWLRIWTLADAERHAAGPDTFARDFGSDEELLSKRQLYICDAHGLPIGTASAWFRANYHGKDYGLVHWVAIVPEFQGKGLSKPLISKVLIRLAGLGHERSMLVTQDYRTPAIKLYLKFGFLPELGNDDERAKWRGVRDRIGPSPLDSLNLG